jgi:hypothetical protein
MGAWRSLVSVLRFLLNVLRRSIQLLCRLLFLLLVAFFLQRSTLQLNDPWYAVAHIVSPYQFDYLGWELNALRVKTTQTLWGTHAYMDEESRSNIVRQYFENLAHAQRLEGQISSVYADPNIADPQTATIELRTERDTLRRDLANRQPTVEAILEGQVAAVLVEEGFGTLGQLLPPMSMHFTNVPNLVVVSPRDSIRMDISINVNPMTVDQQAELEAQIEREQNVSALIVPIGGMALYPAMIFETSYLPWAMETFAHEWLHHYLYFYPLGLAYDFTGEARIINETTADVFGKEIGPKVLRRYYPEYVTRAQTSNVAVQVPSPFDFAAEMNETRVTVDELLAAGEVAEAEAYMEERRRFFAQNGYPIRKLNQAYFAFYGGYQGGTLPGVGGEDPIGPAVRQVREMSDSIHEFVLTLRGVTTREALLTEARRLRIERMIEIGAASVLY